MKTLNISISDIEYERLGLKNNSLSFNELVDIISRKITRLTLDKCVELAAKYKLSEMSIEDITNEVKAVRNI